MMQRFNFLDLFGYLIPGAVLLAALWLPYGLISGEWPSLELASGVLALGFAYVLGHVLQGLAHFALPSKDEAGRYPSDWLLDDGRDDHKQPLPTPVRRIVAMLIAKRFGISVRGDGNKNEALTQRRQSAFLLCRAALVHKVVAGYVEQYQGMYFLTRGLAAAFAACAAYSAGWALALWLEPSLPGALDAILVVVAFTTLLLLPRQVRCRIGRPMDKILEQHGLWIMACILLVLGAVALCYLEPRLPGSAFCTILVIATYAALVLPPEMVRRGINRHIAKLLEDHGLWIAGCLLLIGGAVNQSPAILKTWKVLAMSLIAVTAVFVAYRCRKSSVAFQIEFAKAVYQDFVALETQTPRSLFTELTAQRAFEKWLARDSRAGTPGTDWESAEVELKAEVAHRLGEVDGSGI